MPQPLLQCVTERFLIARVDRLVAVETSIDGITLPAGSLVAAMIYAIHHDEEFWPEPAKFDPER